MRCEDINEYLDDYADGTLAEPQSMQVKEHLDACPACQKSLDELYLLLDQAATLPLCRMPKSDLWSGIETKILSRSDARPVQQLWLHGRRLLFPLAAAALLILGLGTWWAGFSLDTGKPADRNASNLSEEIRKAEDEYDRARQALLATYEKHCDSLDPETREVIQKNMSVISGAIGEIRTALAKDPDNAAVLRMLVATENQRLDLMLLTTRLSGVS
jgi:hypothetical protein